MVLLHVKGTEPRQQFIVEAALHQSVDEVTHECCKLFNLREKLHKKTQSLDDPRLEGLRGLLDESRAERRESLSLQELAEAASKISDLTDVEADVDVSVCTEECKEHEELKDESFVELNDGEKSLEEAKVVVSPETHDMWFSSKRLVQGKAFSLRKYLGNNENSRFIVKFARKGQGRPTNEAPVDESTRRKMMARYMRRKQEFERMEREADIDDDDVFYSREWADPRRMQRRLQGVGEIKFR
ncbi:MAG: hypothetical protein MHM6MM_006359 [Cercozoa sp. M6MM]